MGKKWATQKNAHFFKNQKMAVLKKKKMVTKMGTLKKSKKQKMGKLKKKM